MRILTSEEARAHAQEAIKKLRRGSLFSYSEDTGDVRCCLVYEGPDIFNRIHLAYLHEENVENIFQGAPPTIQWVAISSLRCINILRL